MRAPLLPSVDAAFGGVEVHADEADWKSAILVLLVISAVENLADGLISAFVQFELEDIEAISKLPPKRQNAALAERHEAEWDESFEIGS